MARHSRIDELRRRIQQDPASVAFAQLAEEHRRAGDYDEAVRLCRAGLEQHPLYVSAHVTLGRALTELGKLDEAEAEFEQVLLAAPDNLIAMRSIAELHQRRHAALSEPELPDEARSPAAEAASLPPEPVPPSDAALDELKDWLAAIRADRAGRSGGSTDREPPY